jgi:hypothetical protein
MGQLLHIEPEKDYRCINCHSMFEQVDKQLIDEDLKGQGKLLKDGVSCVACHGPFQNWVKEHSSESEKEQDDWRAWTRDAKQTTYGMTDLWDPIVRTQTCSSCHVGDTKKGRVLTHEMYAAGHPPLSGFDTATFSNGMPPHWQLLRDKKPGIQEKLQYDPKKNGLEQTRIALVGNVASFRENMTLLATQSHLGADNQGQNTLDLAMFDCAQCHHDLKRKSWRQDRGYKSTPGRPQFRTYSTALIKVAIRHTGGGETEIEALDRKIARLYEAFDSRPFGDAKKIGPAAADLVDWAGSLSHKLNEGQTGFDKTSTMSLLKQIVKLPSEDTPDYDTARQIAWCFQTIYDEVLLAYTNSGDPKDESTKIKLTSQREEMAKHFLSLEKGLFLRLPYTDLAAVKKEYPLEDLEARRKLLSEYRVQRQRQYDDYWPENLNRQSEYGPEDFKKTFAAMAKLLP